MARNLLISRYFHIQCKTISLWFSVFLLPFTPSKHKFVLRGSVGNELKHPITEATGIHPGRAVPNSEGTVATCSKEKHISKAEMEPGTLFPTAAHTCWPSPHSGHALTFSHGEQVAQIGGGGALGWL